MGLGGPRRKVKYSIDPNALNWANDESKFGQKLLEKMGWQQGKGLGANEDGIKENIKVKFKCDTKGVGFSNNEYENVWLEHQDDFEQLLSSLKQTSETTQASVDEQVEHGKNQAVQPLEAKSKESRARLHYKKFTKSKDLSTASANDLKCILGTEKRQKSKHQANEQPNSNGKSGSNAETETEDDVDQFRVSFKMSTSETNANGTLEKNLSENSAFQTNKKSISEYFASKMAYRFVKANNETEKKEEQVDELINEEERELQIRIEQSETSEDKNQVDEEESKKKKKKKKKSKKRSRTEDEDIEEVKEEAKTASFEVEERLEVEFEPTLAKPAEHIQRESDMFFKGSNFFKLNGYSAYIINSELEKVMEEKIKRVGRKRFQMEKILQVDSKFYEMNKKKAC